MIRSNLSIGFALAVGLLIAVTAASQDPDPAASPVDFTAEQIAFFETDIRPLLVEHCQSCHGAEKQEGSLRLDSRDALLAGGDTGPAIVPGELDAGELLLAISYDPNGYQMPPEGQLSEESIEKLTRWVEMGAPWTDEATTSVAREEFDLAARAEHWSYQALSHIEPRDVARPEWCRSPLDQYILASLKASELDPANEVDRDLWIRRAYFDVIGIPPTAAEVREFLADDAPDACERVIDRLLASPRFGERWARHWLDLIRYTETRGHQYDYNIPNTWHYRDYVVRAFNADVPYDQFVIEHVAGDLLQPATANQPLASEVRVSHPSQSPVLPSETWYVAVNDDDAQTTESVDETTFTAEQLEFFETDVRPLFVENCQQCHGADEQEGNLRLDSRASILAGGDTGPAIVPGHPDQSELILAISYDPSGYQMPPDGKLSDEAIATLTRWVEMGAPWPNEQTEAASREEFDFAGRAERWSYQPLGDAAPPEVNQSEWCRTPIDRFLLSQLESSSLQPTSEVDRRVWIRRVYLDVIGIPPSAEATTAFVADTSPTAYETVIDQLLSSPHYGERWGRHWLDLARFADSRGHEFDADVPNGWQYRDYVIRAFNDDLPYDQFVVEQVAGDLLRPAVDQHVAVALADGTVQSIDPSALANSPFTSFVADYSPSQPRTQYHARHREDGANESILATGFWFFGEGVHSPVDIRQDEADRFADMIDVFSKTFLGMTVACARCHDHKFDPIRAADFYALQGYLQSTSYRQARFETMDHNRAIARQLDELHDRARPELLKTLAELSQPVVDQLPTILIAAREWIATSDVEGSESFTAEQFSDEQRQQIAQLATERELDANLLTLWTAHLLRARHVLNDPLHIAAQLEPVDELKRQFRLMEIETRRARDAQTQSGEDAPLLEMIYSGNPFAFPTGLGLSLGHSPIQDGVSFGTGELQVGDLILSDDPGEPIDRVVSEAVMRRDPIWNGLSYAPGTIDDPGRLDGWERGGRSLRTPSFDITAGKLYIYLRGGCRMYVEVDSHTINNGPLHGSLMKEHPLPEDDPQGSRWRWVEHDVTRYQGHRAHLQIVLRGTEPLEIAQIVQSDRAPILDSFNYPTGWWESLWPLPADFTNEQALESTTDTLVHTLAALNRENGQTATHLKLAEWMRQHPELFGLDSEAARARFTEVSTPFLEERRELIASIRNESATAPCMMEISPEDEYLFIRGNWKKSGDVVPRRFLEVFHGQGPETGVAVSLPESVDGVSNTIAFGENSDQFAHIGVRHSDPNTSGRLDLALQLVDPEQTPILPRVIVNRIWLHYFGRGIVSTPDDFGYLGEMPSHPELLDWLANELVENDWSLKHIHRIILLSSAYRMSSDVTDPAAEVADPNNVLLHRMNVKRMEGEIIRDAMLTIAGSLNETMYGPPVPVHLTAFMEGRGRPGSSGPLDGNGRRSIYISVRRNFLDPMFQAFDFPLPHTTVGRRSVSNVPAQALTLMNSPLVHELSGRWARRMLDETAESDTDNRITWLYTSAFSRPPTETELAIGREFVMQRAAETGTTTETADTWTEYCHVLLNTKEFIFVR